MTSMSVARFRIGLPIVLGVCLAADVFVADLGTQLEISPQTVDVNEKSDLGIEVYNAGPGDVTDVAFTVQFDADVAYDAAVTLTSADCSSSGSVSAGIVVQCAFHDTVSSGVTAQTILFVRPLTSGVFSFSAQATGTLTDPTPADNSASVTLTANDVPTQLPDVNDPVVPKAILTIAPGALLLTSVTLSPGQLSVPMVQFDLARSGPATAPVELTGMVLQRNGSASVSSDVANVRVILDLDGDALLDDNERVLAEAAWDADEQLRLALDPLAVSAVTDHTLVVLYDFADDIEFEQTADGCIVANAGGPLAIAMLWPVPVVLVFGRRRRWRQFGAVTLVAAIGWSCGTGTCQVPANPVKNYQVRVVELMTDADTGQANVQVSGLPIDGRFILIRPTAR